ncbi:hypothetical protein FEM48_Zijuj04G0011000 [Ziziphus jujuba var. spinosa]|uniref:Protein FAR1-RELATED SEQUENCE n=1 Tax=Ziziphus jujuba var. spinosa TaxID=714518 RepID=A0A978VGY5_ZIZJJ|nr:hypothetical protein FEM48_Zijuj04G0011000 [Ziziphus jujuba var. spinosa]
MEYNKLGGNWVVVKILWRIMEEERQTGSEEVSEHQNGNSGDIDIQSSGTDTKNTEVARRGATSDSSIICPGTDDRSFQRFTVDEAISMKFESVKAAEEFYQRYAHFMGFSI